MIRKNLVCLSVALLLCAGIASAQAPTVKEWAISELKGAEDKLVKLANATPADKFTWRPAEGVRSVSEVYLHVAGGNFSIPSTIGTPLPAGIDRRTYEKSTTEKAKVIEQLKNSYDHAIAAIGKLSDADLDAAVERPGFFKIKRDAVMLLVTHSHEHLGQSIAYARMNGVVPPWTEEQQQKAKQAPAKKSE